ncbi:MAG: hypothetical protein KatS3mg101_0137 [Patescibacteria group bacterium]|nr:MAG: hypothetical protein KatS3mg101_0137 [Patescibacteria group bacterium]
MKPQDIIQNTLENIFGFMKIEPVYEINDKGDKVYEVVIKGNNLNFLIGHRGQSLDALQSILHLTVLRQTGEQVTVIIDINGYRDQRTEKIQNMARSYIDRVRFFQKDVELPPMDPWERRQIHMFVSEYDDIISESIGEGRDRRVTLKLKRQ